MFTKKELLRMFKDGYIKNQRFGPQISDHLPMLKVVKRHDTETWRRVLNVVWFSYGLDQWAKKRFDIKLEINTDEANLMALTNAVILNTNETNVIRDEFYDEKYVDRNLTKILLKNISLIREPLIEATRTRGSKSVYNPNKDAIFGLFVNDELLRSVVKDIDDLSIVGGVIQYSGPRGMRTDEDKADDIYGKLRPVLAKAIVRKVNKDIGLIRNIHETVATTMHVYYNLYRLSPSLARMFREQDELGEDDLMKLFVKYSKEDNI